MNILDYIRSLSNLEKIVSFQILLIAISLIFHAFGLSDGAELSFFTAMLLNIIYVIVYLDYGNFDRLRHSKLSSDKEKENHVTNS